MSAPSLVSSPQERIRGKKHTCGGDHDSFTQRRSGGRNKNVSKGRRDTPREKIREEYSVREYVTEGKGKELKKRRITGRKWL